ncbi:MAG: hypothetical protein ABFD25_05175 [Clostridiaceae bacterium]
MSATSDNHTNEKISAEKGKAFIASTPNYYQKLGILESHIEPWEDGMRTDGSKGSYEWWYFDSILNDGSTLVIIFYTKDMLKPNSPLSPYIEFKLDKPDGTLISKILRFSDKVFSANKDYCHVCIGDSTIIGNLQEYTIHLSLADIKADLALNSTVSSWRPCTGHLLFQNNYRNRYFAWLPSVPQGTIKGTVTINGYSQEITGSGYHDHNWGNASLLELIHNWYWGRAQIGNYTIIANHITATKTYGNSIFNVFMLAYNGKIISNDSADVQYYGNDIQIDSLTGKPVANLIVYDYIDDFSHYRISFKKEKNLVRERLIDNTKGLQYILTKLTWFNGAYLRFTGTAILERLENNLVVEAVEQKSVVWELMYFGKAPKIK